MPSPWSTSSAASARMRWRKREGCPRRTGRRPADDGTLVGHDELLPGREPGQRRLLEVLVVAEHDQRVARDLAEQVGIEVPVRRRHDRGAGEPVLLEAPGRELVGPAEQVGTAAGQGGDVRVGVPEGEGGVGPQRGRGSCPARSLARARSASSGEPATGVGLGLAEGRRVVVALVAGSRRPVGAQGHGRVATAVVLERVEHRGVEQPGERGTPRRGGEVREPGEAPVGVGQVRPPGRAVQAAVGGAAGAFAQWE